MANRSYKSIFHNKKELHEEHSTPVEEIKEEQATEAADTTVEKVSEEKNVEETKEEQKTEAADTTAEKVSEEKPAEKKCFFSFLKPGENRKKVPFILFSFLSLSLKSLSLDSHWIYQF